MNKYKRCILATCTIPWTPKYELDEDVFRDQIRLILKHGTQSIYIFGTAGEGYAVSDCQFKRITHVFCDEMQSHSADPMVGIISLSVTTAIERIEYAYDLGARSFQLSLPSWGSCTWEEIRLFFNETCGRFSDCSFLHYNSSRSQRLITPDEYGCLSDEFPNFVATKNGAGSLPQIILLCRKAPNLRHFLTEFNFAQACLFGLDVGFLISIASMNWSIAKSFYQAGLDCQVDLLRSYIFELEEIHNKLFAVIGHQGHIDGVYDKVFSKCNDPRFSLRLLPPYRYANEETFDEFTGYIRKTYPNWLNKNEN